MNVVGTDFAPYRKLLGRDGLNIPNVVLTDGDPGGGASSGEQGFTRAADLIPDPDRRDDLLARTDELIRLTADGPAEDCVDLRRQLQDLCADDGIFVGDQTLETDLLPLLGDELAAAYQELAPPKRSANMARDIISICRAQNVDGALAPETHELAGHADNEPAHRSLDRHRRARLLSRVDGVGKGRLAQRWAGHIEAIDLRAGVINLLDEAGVEVSLEVDLGVEPVTEALLGQLGSVRASLRALEWASQQARGRPLLDAVDDPDET